MRTPVLIAIIGLALAFVIGVDIRGAKVATRSAHRILNDATRSIELVDDVRWQIHRLGHASQDEVAGILAVIDADITAYTPLPTFLDEARRWASVRDAIALAREAARAGDFDRVRFVTRGVDADVNALVEINHREGESYLAQMDDDRRYELFVDIVAVATAGAILIILARALVRAQSRQRELIEERNRELDSFAGRAAHDLRSPLNPIRGYAELIATDPEVSDATRRQASQITKGVMKMTGVVDDMLALARAGHPDPGEADLLATLTAVRDELAADLREVAIALDASDARIAVSEGSLEQILRNLLGNAAKYRSQERALELRVTARRDGAMHRIEVADNGIGMDDEARIHAFDPFFRARRDISGTGLGLSIVERIARASGGRCELLPNDPGTRVVVWLPAA